MKNHLKKNLYKLPTNLDKHTIIAVTESADVNQLF